ncbi:toll/interleukin-1 receptor domain-containing protein [Fulvivirgaceae bacterium BMA12]|uniref:Toll/interleukin-1 receptor domain-containing protein n=1 Tax=Agaribacillus aureus TaxID=3051825 RepID=A0ABT8LKV6_9BACT|nr:toll/interleukin-1 receptor domain-containing protein [Fulvivirgaceae bacterium BMA12]
MMDNYVYDLFFSYRRVNIPEEKEYGLRWIRTFKSRIAYWLHLELGYEPKIFFDEAIETGQIWRDELKNGLKTAKVMVAIWNPPYFNSKWCCAEWQSFELRAQEVIGSKVLFPVKVFDGDNFPEKAKSREWKDYVALFSNEEYFWKGPKALQLEDEVKVFSKLLAKSIRNPPQFSDFKLAPLPESSKVQPKVKLQNFT